MSETAILNSRDLLPDRRASLLLWQLPALGALTLTYVPEWIWGRYVEGKMMRVEILYFEGCPHHRPTVELVRRCIDECGASAQLEEVEVRNDAHAHRLRFIGSPTVRVDGADVEPGADARRDYAIGCRVYGEAGVPSRDLVVAALTPGA